MPLLHHVGVFDNIRVDSGFTEPLDHSSMFVGVFSEVSWVVNFFNKGFGCHDLFYTHSGAEGVVVFEESTIGIDVARVGGEQVEESVQGNGDGVDLGGHDD